jgi:hypothetical protein
MIRERPPETVAFFVYGERADPLPSLHGVRDDDTNTDINTNTGRASTL